MCSLKGKPQIIMGAERAALLRETLSDRGLDAMFIRDTASIEWLTAFRHVFDDEQAHAAFVCRTDDTVRIHTDSRYSTAMEREATDTIFAVDSERVGFAAWARKMWDQHGGHPGASGVAHPRLGIEDGISLAQYRALEKAFGGTDEREGSSCELTETSDLILGLRAVKDDFEIRRMKAAQGVTDAAFAHIIDYMKPGMTERDIQMELDWFMLKNGADALAFPTIVACGPNGASPHAIVSDAKLEAGQCVVMDFGARWEGYDSDMTRTVFLGEPTGRMLSAWETLRAANERVEATLRPGVTGKQAHELALEVLEEGGFGGLMGHGLGHGVGIQIHEEPVLSPRNEKPLVTGNVVTVEPGIYIPGEFGMRLEDFGVITEKGFEVFTHSTHELVVI